MLSAVNDDLTVHNDIFDANRELLGVRSSSRCFDGPGVEYRDISLHSIAKNPATSNEKALGRERGHFSDRLWQR